MNSHNTTTNNNNSYNANTTNTQIVCFYIVQKCWYSGPKIVPTVDYYRLLPSMIDAEQVAYQSAHVYSNGTSPVRTIQLSSSPSSSTTTTTSTSSYGFVTNGVLFWVRQIHALTSIGVPVNPIIDSAHCIITQNIIGGTTDTVNSRRVGMAQEGTSSTGSMSFQQQQPPRVYVGQAGYAWALQQTTNGLIPIGSTCQWIPVGKPNVDNITAEWPDRQVWPTTIPMTPTTTAQTQNQQQHHHHHGPSKRLSDMTRNYHWFHANSTNSTSTSNIVSDTGSDTESSGMDFSGNGSGGSCSADFTTTSSCSNTLLFNNPPPAKRFCWNRNSSSFSSSNNNNNNNESFVASNTSNNKNSIDCVAATATGSMDMCMG